MLGRSLLHWACCTAALLFALLWLASVVITGFAAPTWIPPAGLLAIALAAAIP